MNWKGFLIGLGIGASPMSVHAQENPAPQSSDTRHTTTITTNNITTKKDSTYVLDPISITFTNNNDTTSAQPDSMSIKTAENLSPEQWANLTPRQKLESCSNLMFLFNIQFEDLRNKAYNDGFGNPTILNGIVYINGKRISKKLAIKDFQKALDTWNNELTRDKGFFDVMEAYLGPAIEKMKPTNEKELLQAQTALCGWLSFTWQRGPNIMGSSNYSKALIASQHLASQTQNKADISRADSLFSKYAKPYVQDYTNFVATGDSAALQSFKTAFLSYNTQSVTKRIKMKNGKYKKITVKEYNESHDRRQKATLACIIGPCVYGVGDCPKSLQNDDSVIYINILETTVGGIHSLGKKLPEDWAEKIQNNTIRGGHTVSDSLKTQYPQLRPEENSQTDGTAFQAKLLEAFQKNK